MTMRLSFRRTALLHTLYFFSGAAGLICEVVWTRWLTGLLGSASAATAMVLAVFMAGLGVGSWLSARFADRIQRPFRVYAFVELGVAALVFLPLWEARGMTSLFQKLAELWGPVSPALDAARFIVAVVAIGPPTVLMGASLPVVVRALTASRELLGRNTATAYAANSLGGVCGTLVAGFYLIEALGLRTTCLTAGGMAALVGVAALWLDRRISVTASNWVGSAEHFSERELPPEAEVDKSRMGWLTSRQTDIEPRASVSWVLVAAAVSGFCALGYENVWSRVLSLLTLNTTYAFSLMLSIVLSGLSLGSWLVRRRLDRQQDPAMWFAMIQSLLSLYALTSLLWVSSLAGLADQWIAVDGQGLLPAWFGRPLIIGMALLLLPATLMGASLPVACKLYASLTSGVGRPIGRTYAANTFGSVLGALVVGLVLIPTCGTGWAITACSLLGAGTAWGVAWAYSAPNRRRVTYAIVAAGVVIGCVMLGIAFDDSFITRQNLGGRDVVVFKTEDEYGLIEVVEDKQIGTRWMLTNRLHWEGSTLPRAVAEQRKQGLLPLVLHPSPRRVLEIGVGTGIKLGALQSDIVDETVAVELSSGVIKASQFFADYNHRFGLSSPQLDVVCADGRNYVAFTPREFDVIVNGLLTPYRAGVSRLYTQEHFRACRAKLASDGVFVVWVALRQIAAADLKVLTRTLLDVFPHTTMWMDGYYLALVSSKQMPKLNVEEIERRCTNQALANALVEAGLESPSQLLATFVAGPQMLARFADGQPLNTENRPIIEFRTPRLGDRLNTSDLAAENLGTVALLQEPLFPKFVTASDETRARLVRAQQARWTSRQALVEKCYGRHLVAAKLFGKALAEEPTDDLARYELEIYLVAHGKRCVERGLLRQAHRVFHQAVRVNPRSLGALASLAVLEERAGNFDEAASLWHRVRSSSSSSQKFGKRDTKSAHNAVPRFH